MNDERIAHFETLMPDQFMSVVKHDWWQGSPLDEIGLRVELEPTFRRRIDGKKRFQ